MSGISRRGLCLVLAGPSGGGKSSIGRALLEQEPRLTPSISVTTRPPRSTEQDGVDYHFCSEAEFIGLRDTAQLLEWARVLGRHYYGTPRQPVQTALAAGNDVLFDIDWQGYRSLKATMPGDVVGVFLLPPSLPALESRLIARGDDQPNEIARRMERAREEISHCAEFEHVIVNEAFEQTVAEVRAVLRAARTATGRLSGLAGFIARLDGGSIT
jgi:guanylate kinase